MYYIVYIHKVSTLVNFAKIKRKKKILLIDEVAKKKKNAALWKVDCSKSKRIYARARRVALSRVYI